MNEQKQIEEMAKVLVDYTMKKHIMASYVILEEYAEQIHNVGYRKQSEVAMEIFEEIEKFTYRYLNDADYSGGDLIYDISELKKKYTEGENDRT